MSAVGKAKAIVGTAGALATIVQLKVTEADDGRVSSVKVFGVIPLFRRVGGKARVLGIRAKRLD